MNFDKLNLKKTYTNWNIIENNLFWFLQTKSVLVKTDNIVLSKTVISTRWIIHYVNTRRCRTVTSYRTTMQFKFGGRVERSVLLLEVDENFQHVCTRKRLLRLTANAESTHSTCFRLWPPDKRWYKGGWIWTSLSKLLGSQYIECQDNEFNL